MSRTPPNPPADDNDAPVVVIDSSPANDDVVLIDSSPTSAAPSATSHRHKRRRRDVPEPSSPVIITDDDDDDHVPISSSAPAVAAAASTPTSPPNPRVSRILRPRIPHRLLNDSLFIPPTPSNRLATPAAMLPPFRPSSPPSPPLRHPVRIPTDTLPPHSALHLPEPLPASSLTHLSPRQRATMVLLQRIHATHPDNVLSPSLPSDPSSPSPPAAPADNSIPAVFAEAAALAAAAATAAATAAAATAAATAAPMSAYVSHGVVSEPLHSVIRQQLATARSQGRQLNHSQRAHPSSIPRLRVARCFTRRTARQDPTSATRLPPSASPPSPPDLMMSEADMRTAAHRGVAAAMRAGAAAARIPVSARVELGRVSGSHANEDSVAEGRWPSMENGNGRTTHFAMGTRGRGGGGRTMVSRRSSTMLGGSSRASMSVTQVRLTLLGDPFVGAAIRGEALDYEQLVRWDEDILREKNRAKQQQIEALPVHAAKEEDKQVRCCICLSDVQVGEELKVLPCKHKHHKSCIDEWLSYNGCCPVCKKRIALDEPRPLPSAARFSARSSRVMRQMLMRQHTEMRSMGRVSSTVQTDDSRAAGDRAGDRTIR